MTNDVSKADHRMDQLTALGYLDHAAHGRTEPPSPPPVVVSHVPFCSLCEHHQLSPRSQRAWMSLRGVRSAGARTITSAMSGLVRDDHRTRAEFLALAG
jgi:GTP cyclohydrolase I